MKKLLPLIVAALGLVCGAGLAHAAEGVFAARQHHVSACEQQAGNRQGEERRAFIKQCARERRLARRQKAQACRQDAQGKSGAQRRAFMHECMSK